MEAAVADEERMTYCQCKGSVLYYLLCVSKPHGLFERSKKLRAYHFTTNFTTKPSVLAEICGELWRGRGDGYGMVVELRMVAEIYRRFLRKIPTMKPID